MLEKMLPYSQGISNIKFISMFVTRVWPAFSGEYKVLMVSGLNGLSIFVLCVLSCWKLCFWQHP